MVSNGEKMMKSIVLSTMLAMVCFSASAQWVWMDSNGNKVYSDRAPSIEIPEKDILKRPAPRAPALSETPAVAASTPASAASPPPPPPPAATGNGNTSNSNSNSNSVPSELDKALEAKKKQAKEAELARKKADDERIWKAKVENCARAKQAYATYNSNAPIARINAEGGREMVDSQTRAAELQRAQTLMAQNCN